MPTGIYIRTKETRMILSKSHLGQKWTDEHRYNHRLAMKNMSDESKSNRVNAARLAVLGSKRTEEQKKHLSDIKKGSGSWNWKGGISPLYAQIRNLRQYKLWRNAIFERDFYACVLCGDSRGKTLQVDHYPISRAEIVKRNNITKVIDAELCTELWDINNGRTLCEPCHKETPTFGGRMHSYLKQLIEEQP